MKNINLGLLTLRVSLGIMMLLHGIAKLNSGLAPIENLLSTKGLPGLLAYGTFIGEVVAPILIIVGYRTRLASAILFINCIFIIFLGPYSIWDLGKFGGWDAELPGLFLFSALALVFTGAGSFAISHKNKWD